MVKLLAALLVVGSFLFVAPIIESSSGSTEFFQAIGTADAGGGG